EHRRAVAALEHFELDPGDRDHLRLSLRQAWRGPSPQLPLVEAEPGARRLIEDASLTDAAKTGKAAAPLWQLEQRLRIAMADLFLVHFVDVECGDHLHGLAHVTCAALRAERRVRGKQHVIGAEKFEPADCSDAAAAERRVGVKVLEAMHQRL